MSRVVLLSSAHLHIVTLLQPEVRSDDGEMNYFFRVNIQYCSSFVVCFNIDGVSPTLQLKCEQCGWISENEECVNMAVQERAPGSSRRNSRVNLSLKVGSISVILDYFCSLSLLCFCLFLGLVVWRVREAGDNNTSPRTCTPVEGRWLYKCATDGFWLQRNLPGVLLLQRRMVGRYGNDILIIILYCIIHLSLVFLTSFFFLHESGRSINLNLFEGKYNVVVDGEYIEIKELKTKFEPYNGWHYAWFFV